MTATRGSPSGSETSHDELRRLAEAATPGPWYPSNIYTDHTEECGEVVNEVRTAPDVDGDTAGERVICTDGGYYTKARDARYIAAAHPTAILALLDALEMAQAKAAVLAPPPRRGWAMKLFLDDKREIGSTAPAYVDATWHHVRTADEAINCLKAFRVEEASLDHDLGYCEACQSCDGYKSPCGCRCHLTGYFVVCWMETENVWPPGGVRVHSANPVGAAKMRVAIDRHYRDEAGRRGRR